MTQKVTVKVGIVMGSDSDYPVLKGAGEALDKFNISYEMGIVSAHRTPDLMAEYATQAENRGIRVIIAGAGGAAHLPGMIAAFSTLPVIGVPIPVGYLQGSDALLSIVQMPQGVPVATVAIGGAFNAGLLAAQILAFGGETRDGRLCRALSEFKADLKAASIAKTLP